MKVAISNLGNIQKAEIELSPFTVFIGRSGTGKSWTAYTIDISGNSQSVTNTTF
ncbi:hypothetical protein [Cylindrospermopsis raciborskii]|uniref:hypothetical protein n=1 Tax=Cylindrospermopsis raciborskii TaxID=77022 RepID=UPI0015E07D24|nr:hypothetical protein [Cylindrospermopsis raciborskii]